MNGFNRCCGGNKGAQGAVTLPGTVGGCQGVSTMPAQVKPVCKHGGHHVHGAQALPGTVPGAFPTQWDSVSKVTEAAVECVQEFHHYAKVEHVIPVYVKNIHHQHTQHDYIIQQAGSSDETYSYEYGLECEKDVCELIAQCGCR